MTSHMIDDIPIMSAFMHVLTHKVLFYSLLFYSILFTSILFYSIPFKSNFSIRGISSYGNSGLTSGMPALNRWVYKVPPVVDSSLTLTINIASP
jgi:hypothetical protein